MDKLVKSTYKLKDHIAEDIISQAYTGVHVAQGTPVIVWKYKAAYLRPAIVPDLLHLAEKLLTVNHPNILKLLDYHYDGFFFYTIHEFKENIVSLDTVLGSEKKWHLKTIYGLTKQLLSALMVLDELNISAGMINLRHLFVTQKKDLRLVPIGISIAIIKANFKDLDILEDGIFYPPEFLQKQRVSPQADIYSFGVLLYFFYTSRWPYYPSERISFLQKELLKTPPSPSKINPKILPKLSQIIETCLSKNPENRFQSIKLLNQTYLGQVPLQEESTTIDDQTIKEDIEMGLRQKRTKHFFQIVKNSFLVVVPVTFFIVLYMVYYHYLTAIPKVQVPDLVGLPVETVESIIKEKQLRFEVIGERHHPLIPEGYVIETVPPAIREVKENRIIRLFVSKGKQWVLVPNLRGKFLDQIMQLYHDVPLLIEVQDEQYSRKYPKGTIMDQQPSENIEQDASTTINVTLSKGFPVAVSALPNYRFFTKSQTAEVTLSLSVLEDWPTQNIRVYSIYKGDNTILFEGESSSNVPTVIEHKLPLGSYLEVYYDQELAYKEQVKDILLENE